MFDIPLVIFAGGKSSRMGEDKSLLPFGEYQSLAQFQYERLRPFFKQIFISTKTKEKFNFKANFIEDDSSFDIFAPTIGLYSSLKILQKDILVISVDTPLITVDILSNIITSHKNHDATIAFADGYKHPLIGIYSIKLLPYLEKMIQQNQHKLGILLKDSNTQYIEFDNIDKFANLNTPQEYKEVYKSVKR